MGEANLPAHGTKKTFNPMIAGRHPTNMHLRLLRSTSIWLPQSNSENVSSHRSRRTSGNKKNQAPDFSEARSLHGARGTSARAAISRYVIAEIVAVNEWPLQTIVAGGSMPRRQASAR